MQSNHKQLLISLKNNYEDISKEEGKSLLKSLFTGSEDIKDKLYKILNKILKYKKDSYGDRLYQRESNLQLHIDASKKITEKEIINYFDLSFSDKKKIYLQEIKDDLFPDINTLNLYQILLTNESWVVTTKLKRPVLDKNIYLKNLQNKPKLIYFMAVYQGYEPDMKHSIIYFPENINWRKNFIPLLLLSKVSIPIAAFLNIDKCVHINI